MVVKKYPLIILLFVIFLSSFQRPTYGKNRKYIIIEKRGTVYLYRDKKLKYINDIPKYLIQGDIVITKRDSNVILKINDRFVKVFSFSKVAVKDIPLLVYGKIQVSDKRRFKELHYRIYPLLKEGKTTRIILWGGSNVHSLSGAIESKDKTIENIDFFRINNKYYKALVGVPLGIEDGKYKIKISVLDKNNYNLIKYPFYVGKMKYRSGVVELKPEKRKLILPSKEKSLEWKILKSVLQRSSLIQYWKGKFMYPVKKPKIISGFGKKRKYYIGGSYLYQRFHYGIDLYGKRGDDVFAPNSGVVVFAGNRITTGNTIVIDHGLGVYSLFFHLNKINVKKGDFVGKGCLIGEIGSTGLAESPHLHWGLMVNMVYVDPLQWIKIRY